MAKDRRAPKAQRCAQLKEIKRPKVGKQSDGERDVMAEPYHHV
jgi:hypothetical protein